MNNDRRSWIILVTVLLTIALIIAVTSYVGLIDIRSAISSWIFELLTAVSVQLLSFFNNRSLSKGPIREALANHYKRLNENIFIPLRDGQYSPQVFPRPLGQLYRIQFSWIFPTLMSNDYWDKAAQHLKKDIPDYVDRLKEVERQGKEYDNELASFRESSERAVQNKLETVAEVTPQILFRGSILISHVMELIETSWLQIQDKWPDGLKTELANLQSFLLKPRVDEREGEQNIFLDSTPVARGLTQDQTKEMVRIIIEFVSNESMIRTVRRFVQLRQELEDKGRTLSSEIGKIAHSIDDNQYTTIVSCCKQIMHQF